MDKLKALSEMKNVARDPALGGWTSSQRAIIGNWVTAIEKPEELKPVPGVPKPPKKKWTWKNARAKFLAVYKFCVGLATAVLVMAFLYFGAVFFHYAAPVNKNIDQIGGEDTNAVCFQSGLGLSCLPKWLVEMPKLGASQTVSEK